MNRSTSHRELALAGIVLAAFVLLTTFGSLPASVSARPGHQKRSSAFDEERNIRQSELKVRLASTNPSDFREALADLVRSDEPGALQVWKEALRNPAPGLQREAWEKYRSIQSELVRKEFVPQIARIEATADEVENLAKSIGIEVTIWGTSGNRTFAAAPPYL